MTDYDRLKIVVAGDSGVGKTAFVHLLCYGDVLFNPSWTVGCSIELSVGIIVEFSHVLNIKELVLYLCSNIVLNSSFFSYLSQFLHPIILYYFLFNFAVI